VRRITELLTSIKSKNQDLLNSNEELERYAYILSHDLKSPINNIVSFANLSKKRIKAGEFDDLDTFMSFVKSSGIKMNELANSVLDYAILNKTYGKKEAVNLNETLQETFRSK